MSQAGKFVIGNASPTQTLTGNTGGPVGPDGSFNINVVGSGDLSVAGNPATNTLTISVNGTVADSFPTDFGVAEPIAGALQIVGDGDTVTTSGVNNIVTITTDGALATDYNTDSGTAIPALHILNVLGGNNIATSGAGDTLTIDLNGTTNHSLQVGNASGSLTSLGVATNGQLPIGSTGADPVLATLTAGSGISITNGAGSITISSSGADILAYTNVNTTPYVVLSTDEYLSVDCSGAPITVQLPNTATSGRVYIIKDRTGSANTNNITVTTVGGAVNIDGATTYVMNTQYASIEVIGNGSTYEIF